jgi:integrase
MGKYQVMRDLTEIEMDELRESIKANGILTPLAFGEHGNVLDGHHRLILAKELGITDYPRTIHAGLSEEEKYRFSRDVNVIRRQLSREEIREETIKGTVDKVYQAAKMLFADAAHEGIIESDPAARLKKPQAQTNERRPMEKAEREAMLKVCNEHPHDAYALVMLYTGVRRGECLALTAEDVDIEARKLNVSKSVEFKDNQGIITGTKASKLRKNATGRDSGVRTVPIPDILIPTLIELCNDKVAEDLLFHKRDGSLASQITVRRWWSSIKRRCHIAAGASLYRNAVLVETSPFDPDITQHYLRHTYATDLYNAGVDENARKTFLGHSMKNDVTDTYTAMTDKAFYRALDLINEHIKATDMID